MAKEMARCEISHNDIGEIDRGTWRKYNPYNPYVEEKDEKTVDNLNIESLDDLFDDLDNNANKTTNENNNGKLENKNNVKEEMNEDKINSILDLEFEDDAPVLPQEQENSDEDTYDLQKELEAKFDELFGPLEDEE